MAKRIAVAIAIVGLVVLWFSLQRTPSREVLSPDAAPPAQGETSDHPATDIVSSFDGRDPILEEQANEPACLTPWQLDDHPMFAEEAARTESLLNGGPHLEAFRGLSRDEVLTFEAQNDTAAMVVLGAMAMMRASGEDENLAFSYINPSEGDSTIRKQYGETLSEEAKREYQNAHDWFYKAAVHGRLLALSNAGDALYTLEPNPIKQGWISRADYDAIERKQRAFLNVSGIYSAAMAEIAGNPKDGIIGMLLSIQPRSDAVDALAEGVIERFEADRTAAGLPPIQIPKSTLPSPDEIVAMVCKEYWPEQDE